MTERVTERRRTVRVPLVLDHEVERYAEQHGFSYSEAARDLWDRTLADDFDDDYAPLINEAIRQMGDSVVAHVEELIDFGFVEQVLLEIRLSGNRKIVVLDEQPLDDEDPNLNSNASSVFMPECYEDEKDK